MNAITHDGQPSALAGEVLLDKPRVAQYLHVSVGTVDNLRTQGKLGAIKVGSKVRFKPAEVERYLESERENVDGADVPVQDGGAKQGGKASRNGKVKGKDQKPASRGGAAEERKPTK
jgi:excisionase family DNA binding protein